MKKFHLGKATDLSDRHDIAEILLKVALNPIQSINQSFSGTSP
jgi:hypothetical protein